MKLLQSAIGLVPEVINHLTARQAGQYVEKRTITGIEYVSQPAIEGGAIQEFTILKIGHPDLPNYNGQILLWGKFELGLCEEYLQFILATENQIVEEKARHEAAMDAINFSMYDWQAEMRKASRENGT